MTHDLLSVTKANQKKKKRRRKEEKTEHGDRVK